LELFELFQQLDVNLLGVLAEDLTTAFRDFDDPMLRLT
jgi:hypothetical protein